MFFKLLGTHGYPFSPREPPFVKSPCSPTPLSKSPNCSVPTRATTFHNYRHIPLGVAAPPSVYSCLVCASFVGIRSRFLLSHSPPPSVLRLPHLHFGSAAWRRIHLETADRDSRPPITLCVSTQFRPSCHAMACCHAIHLPLILGPSTRHLACTLASSIRTFKSPFGSGSYTLYPHPVF